MAKNKSAQSKPAGKFKVQAGGSGKMQKFSQAAPQKADSTAQQSNKGGKGAPFPQGGPSGKMQSFSPTKPQKSGTSAQQSGGGGRSSYAK